MKDVLGEIVEHKKIEVNQRKEQLSLNQLKQGLSPSERSLYQALSNRQSDFIFECKKASPSKGLIRENFDLDEILEQYKDYASAISVLTDKKYFQGDFSFLQRASKKVNLPILCKDFFIDSYQVYEARYYGADAILLMLSVLDDSTYCLLAEAANSLNMDILTEVHDTQELARAISLDAKIIGINNRNLKDLSIDLATTEKLASKLSNEQLVISESGISSHQDVKRLAPLVNGFLVGSSIMAKKDIRSQCKELVFGKVKICGLTRVEDAIQVDRCGGVYGGFIFYPGSKRYIDIEHASSIINKVPLKYVGVFVNQELEQVIKHVDKLKLHVVQLHGSETIDYIRELRSRLPTIKIWKVIHVNQSIDFVKIQEVDQYLLDTFSIDEYGGTGKSFDWKLLKEAKADDFIIAGGITPENIIQASNVGAFAIDLSSGVESTPGIKSPDKIALTFNQIRA